MHAFIQSGPVVAMIVDGPAGTIAKIRELVGRPIQRSTQALSAGTLVRILMLRLMPKAAPSVTWCTPPERRQRPSRRLPSGSRNLPASPPYFGNYYLGGYPTPPLLPLARRGWEFFLFIHYSGDNYFRPYCHNRLKMAKCLTALPYRQLY